LGLCRNKPVPAHRFVNQFERIAAILDSLIKCCDCGTKQPHKLPHRLNAVLIATFAPTSGTREHAADKPVKHLDRRVGKSGLKVDHCGRQRRPPAIDTVIRQEECRCHAAFAEKLGKAEFRNGAPNCRVDTYAANIAQALKQAIDIGRSRGFFEITQPRQRRHAEIRVVDYEFV